MHSYLGKKSAILVFILPFLLVYTFMMTYPIIQTFFRSFYQWDGITAPIFTGLDNYVRMFNDPEFLPAVKNGLIFAAVIFVYQQGVGTILALILSTKGLVIRGKKFLKTAYFIPVVLSGTVVCQLWVQLYNSEHGLINKLFALLGTGYSQAYLAEPSTAIYAVAITNGWQFMGVMFVFLYAAIKVIPEHYYEAATIDGASFFTLHRRITLPLLAETYKFTFILSITGGLKAFDNMYIMTGGGPGGSTLTLSYLMYKSAFQRNEFGYGCVPAVLLVIECLLFTLMINKLMAKERIVY